MALEPQATKTILTVDDAAFVHQIYRVSFRKIGGCTLVEATNGLEALRQLEAHGPVDLIILDLNMPQMDGLQFLDELKKGRHWGTHVMVSTTEDRDGPIREALLRGAQSFIKKPFTLDQFTELMRKVLPTLSKRGEARS